VLNQGWPVSLWQGHARKTKGRIDAYEPDAFKLNLTQAEAQKRIVMLSAKRPLLNEPRLCCVTAHNEILKLQRGTHFAARRFLSSKP
jgi:hypothetical protein